MPKHGSTQNDVARLAGVMRGPVSLVLSQRSDSRVPISEDTRERVLQAADRLACAANPVAHKLARGSSAIYVLALRQRFESLSFSGIKG